MAKETSFEHPPRGHVALLVYDPANDRFQVLRVESGTYPNLRVAIASGPAQAHVGSPSGDNFAPGTPGLFVVGHLYGFDGQYWDRLRCTDQKLDVVLHGWDGSQARKLGMTWSYSDTLHGRVYDLNVPGGAFDLNAPPVPQGEVWVIHNIGYYWAGASCSILEVRVDAWGTICNLGQTHSPTSGIWYYIRTTVVLKEGEILRLRGYGLKAGDDLYLDWSGYRMKVNQ